MQMYKTIVIFAAVLFCIPSSAQTEGGLIVDAGAEKKLGKLWTVGAEAELRTRNNFRTIDRWAFSVNGSYKVSQWLKASAGYMLLYNNFRDDLSYKTSGDKNNWRPSYWGIRHRFNATLSASHKFSNNIRLSLRERWQYTYRPTKTVTRWDIDNSKWESVSRSAAGKNQLRSRLQIEYDRKRALFTPFVNAEMYNSWSVEKIRYHVGTDIRLSKQHSMTVYYRYQDVRQRDPDDDPDMHYLGVSYKYKF